MQYTPVFLKTENELNKVLRKQKQARNPLGVLFVSLWDDHSKKLVKELKDKPLNPNGRTKPLYVVDSYTMPHAFVIFKTTKLPHLVQFKKGRGVESEDYLSKVYQELGL
tara:strand:- start:1576 stop:1902 length:327 start_codon:yes stop_codon:yes gene_type:complete